MPGHLKLQIDQLCMHIGGGLRKQPEVSSQGGGGIGNDFLLNGFC